MVIYCVNVAIAPDIHDDWLAWMREHHIPDVLATGHFLGNTLRRRQEPVESDGYIAYSIEYQLATREQLDIYQRDHAPALQADHTHRYADKFRASRAIFQVID